MNQLLLTTVVALTLTITSANADYVLGDFSYCLKSSTHVVDATVVETTAEGDVRLEIHQHVKGQDAPTLLTGVSLTCRGGEKPNVHLKTGKRYVIMLRGSKLYEGGLRYEVVNDKDGALGCRLDEHQMKWLGLSSNWISLEDMAKLMSPTK